MAKNKNIVKFHVMVFSRITEYKQNWLSTSFVTTQENKFEKKIVSMNKKNKSLKI